MNAKSKRGAEEQDKIRVLLVDDEKFYLEATSKALEKRGCRVTTASSAADARDQFEARFFDVVVLDIRMPGMDGVDFLSQLKSERPTQQVIMVTGHATVSKAVEAMKLGAFDFLLKPCKIEDLVMTIRRAAEHKELERSNIALQEELERTRGSGLIVGESEGIRKIHEFIETAASSDLPVFISGESGTGKELVARAIHQHSPRSKNPLVVVDGSTLKDDLIASELFGHEKGAFTGAVRKKVGLFEVADRGSIFLDEITELSSANQASLLRVIEYGTFRPVGSVKETSTDVRIITATNQDIGTIVEKGKFREDLFYRLNGLAVHVPPLRARKSDIPLLVDYFLKNSSQSMKVSKEVLSLLNDYMWPGNVRELKYVIERAALLARKEGKIEPSHLPEDVRGKVKKGLPAPETLTDDQPSLTELQSRYESFYISRLLNMFDGNKSQVARVLGVSRSVLYEKLNRLGLE